MYSQPVYRLMFSWRSKHTTQLDPYFKAILYFCQGSNWLTMGQVKNIYLNVASTFQFKTICDQNIVLDNSYF